MYDGDLRVRLLGPVDVAVGGVARTVSGLRRQAVLAVLALHPGETVSADRLIDIVWGESQPATAANTLQSHVSHLRGVLGSRALIVSRTPGYLLDLPARGTDLAVAEQLIARGRQATDPTVSVESLRAALALWRGTALSDVTGIPWLAEQATRIENLRLEAVHALVDARLTLGEHTPLVAELQRLAEEHPFREHTHRQLMLALYRTGRQADALAAYQHLRRSLRDELGIEPSPEVRDLEAAILRQDPSLTPAAPVVAIRPAPEVPAQLPLTVSAFTGREAEIAQLDAIVAEGQTNIVTVSGTAGVGKTALAVHWAHRAAASFPDGQLYVNLRGFHPSGSFMASSVAIRGFLEAFGVPADRIPSGADAQASLYRSVLADRRVLIVADNARDAEQVRPLLPGAPGCFVLVTSRSELGGLVATEGAHPIVLPIPSTDEARDMFTRRVGARRVAADPTAVDEIVARCARLPLALAITAARSALQPGLGLADLAEQLRDTEAGLDPFRGDDSATDVRAVFSWSYRTLSPEAARLFRAIGLNPGPDISVDAAASLVGLPPRTVRAQLAELTRGHLISEYTPGRYRFHDLLSTYSEEQGERYDPPDVRCAAQHRLFDHYLHTAYAAAMLLTPNRHPIPLTPPDPAATIHPLADPDEAMAWLSAEHASLLAVVAQDVEAFDRQVWQLAWTLTTYLERRGYWRENIAVQEAGLRAAVRVDDELGQAYAHRNLGNTDTRAGCYTDARDHFEQALKLFSDYGDEIVVAHTRLSVAWTLERQQRQDEALEHVEAALATYRAAGNRQGVAYALNTAGHCQNALGRYEKGRIACVEALEIFRELGDRPGEAGTLDSLGYLYFKLGDQPRAARAYQDSIALYRALGDRYSEADGFLNLGDSYREGGDEASAVRAWRAAAEIFDQLDHPAAVSARARLAAVTARSGEVHRAFASDATFAPAT